MDDGVKAAFDTLLEALREAGSTVGLRIGPDGTWVYIDDDDTENETEEPAEEEAT